MSRIFKKLNIEEASPSERSAPELKLVPTIDEDPRPSIGLKKKTKKITLQQIQIIGLCVAMVIGGSFAYQKYISNNAKPVVLESVVAKEKIGADEQEHQDAMALYREKDYLKALEKFETLLKKHPKDAVITNNIGLTYLKLNDFKNAESKFQEVLKINPKDGVTYNNLGSLRMVQMSFEESISYFYQAILYQPEMIEPHLNLAKAFELAGRPMESIPEYQYYLDHTVKTGDQAIRQLIEKRIVKLNSFSRYIEHAE